ncbi:MAG: hypothetical protein V4623_07875 [Pseudomonadota bacterium]
MQNQNQAQQLANLGRLGQTGNLQETLGKKHTFRTRLRLFGGRAIQLKPSARVDANRKLKALPGLLRELSQLTLADNAPSHLAHSLKQEKVQYVASMLPEISQSDQASLGRYLKQFTCVFKYVEGRQAAFPNFDSIVLTFSAQTTAQEKVNQINNALKIWLEIPENENSLNQLPIRALQQKLLGLLLRENVPGRMTPEVADTTIGVGALITAYAQPPLLNQLSGLLNAAAAAAAPVASAAPAANAAANPPDLPPLSELLLAITAWLNTNPENEHRLSLLALERKLLDCLATRIIEPTPATDWEQYWNQARGISNALRDELTKATVGEDNKEKNQKARLKASDPSYAFRGGLNAALDATQTWLDAPENNQPNPTEAQKNEKISVLALQNKLRTLATAEGKKEPENTSSGKNTEAQLEANLQQIGTALQANQNLLQVWQTRAQNLPPPDPNNVQALRDRTEAQEQINQLEQTIRTLNQQKTDTEQQLREQQDVQRRKGGPANMQNNNFALQQGGAFQMLPPPPPNP